MLSFHLLKNKFTEMETKQIIHTVDFQIFIHFA